MVETFQTAVAEYGMVTTLLLAMVAGMGYIIWKRLLQQPKTNGKRSASTDKTNSIMQAIQSRADTAQASMDRLHGIIDVADHDLRAVIDGNAKEGRDRAEGLRDDLDQARRELRSDIKSVHEDLKVESESRREDVITLHQKIDKRAK
jgi:F0F1-type ATP synthase assembly protein I